MTDKLVPVEPTEEMLEAAYAVDANDNLREAGDLPNTYREVYKAMLAAAPKETADTPYRYFDDEHPNVAATLSDEEWRHEASMALAAFITLSAEPNTVEWGKVAIHATKLLNAKLANRGTTQNAELVKRIESFLDGNYVSFTLAELFDDVVVALERGEGGEAVAWMIELADSQYPVDSLDDPQAVDDLTNANAVATPLYR